MLPCCAVCLEIRVYLCCTPHQATSPGAGLEQLCRSAVGFFWPSCSMDDPHPGLRVCAGRAVLCFWSIMLGLIKSSVHLQAFSSGCPLPILAKHHHSSSLNIHTIFCSLYHYWESCFACEPFFLARCQLWLMGHFTPAIAWDHTVILREGLYLKARNKGMCCAFLYPRGLAFAAQAVMLGRVQTELVAAAGWEVSRDDPAYCQVPQPALGCFLVSTLHRFRGELWSEKWSLLCVWKWCLPWEMPELWVVTGWRITWYQSCSCICFSGRSLLIIVGSRTVG